MAGLLSNIIGRSIIVRIRTTQPSILKSKFALWLKSRSGYTCEVMYQLPHTLAVALIQALLRHWQASEIHKGLSDSRENSLLAIVMTKASMPVHWQRGVTSNSAKLILLHTTSRIIFRRL